MQRLGYNPYIVVPGDPAVAALHTLETRDAKQSRCTEPVSSRALSFSFALSQGSMSLPLHASSIRDLRPRIVLVLLDVLRRTGQGAHWVLAYAWHPLLATEVAGSGHIDILGTLLLLVSFAALIAAGAPLQP